MPHFLVQVQERVRAWWRSLSPFWQSQFLGWGVFTVVDMVNRQFTYHNFVRSLILTIFVFPVLILVTAGLREIYRHKMPDARLTPLTLFVIFLASTAGALIVVSIVAVVRQVTGWDIPEWGPMEEVVVPWIHYSFVVAGWSICYFWVRAEFGKQGEQKRAIAAEAEALRTEVQHLRLQLDPHFLFNALNGVAEEIPEHPDAALSMIRDLTDYLRHSLAGIDTPIVPVEAEVAALGAYLRIQEARFGDRLRTRLNMDPAAASRPIANFLLQPLVENAVKHGARATGLDVDIEIFMEAGAVRVEITNTGTLDNGGSKRHGRGIGLQNVRRRLDVHYPDRHIFTLRQTFGSGEPPTEGQVMATLVLMGEPCSGS